MTETSVANAAAWMLDPSTRVEGGQGAPSPGLWVETSAPGCAVTVCAVTGDIGLETLPRLQRHLDGIQADPAVQAVVVDLTGVEFCAVAGVEALLAAAGRAAVARREFTVVPATRGVRRAFEITGADAEIPWYTSRNGALEAAEAWVCCQHTLAETAEAVAR